MSSAEPPNSGGGSTNPQARDFALSQENVQFQEAHSRLASRLASIPSNSSEWLAVSAQLQSLVLNHAQWQAAHNAAPGFISISAMGNCPTNMENSGRTDNANQDTEMGDANDVRTTVKVKTESNNSKKRKLDQE